MVLTVAIVAMSAAPALDVDWSAWTERRRATRMGSVTRVVPRSCSARMGLVFTAGRELAPPG